MKSKSLDVYELADKCADYLTRQYVREFNKSSASMKFDALNVIKKSKKLYSWLDTITRETYLMMANVVYQSYANDDDSLDELWLSGILDSYDPVTLYVYTNEWERKRQLYAEGMIASKDKSTEKRLSLARLTKQAVQYTITVSDAAQIDAYKANGVKRVRWVSEKDSRVCDVCSKRDGHVYPINDLPPKPHYNCRCRFEPVED